MGKLFSAGLITLLLLTGTALAHEDDNSLPAWTYWTEIAEHTAMSLIAIGGIAYLSLAHKKLGANIRPKVNSMILGLSIFAISQILTDMQHFLIYPFGVWSGIVNHGFLLAAAAVMIYSYIGLLKGKRS